LFYFGTPAAPYRLLLQPPAASVHKMHAAAKLE